MMGPGASRLAQARWSVVVSLLVAAAMATIAFVTVHQAGCPDPGRYVATSTGYELVGGCVDPNDLPVAPDVTPAPASPDTRSPIRP